MSKSVQTYSIVKTSHSVYLAMNNVSSNIYRTRIVIFSMTSFCSVNFNAASSGLRENVIFANTYLPFRHQNTSHSQAQHHPTRVQVPQGDLKVQFQGYSHSGQGSGNGGYGQTGLYQQCPWPTHGPGHAKLISKDPNPKLKNQLIHVLKDCKTQGKINGAIYPTYAVPA